MPRVASVSSDAVVDVAERLLDTEGIEALSARRLASELGVSRQVVYTHFGSMNDVLEVLHRRAGHHLTHVVESLAEPDGADDKLVAAARAYVDVARSRPAMFELMFEQPVPGYQPSREATGELREAFRTHIVDLIVRWSRANEIAASDAANVRAARIYWSAIHGLVSLERAGHASTGDTDEFVEETVRTITAGWRASSMTSSQRSPKR